jgi:hypothetical protein
MREDREMPAARKSASLTAPEPLPERSPRPLARPFAKASSKPSAKARAKVPAKKKAGVAAKAPVKPRRTKHRHHVYVVELADQVWNRPRFRAANPDYQLGKPFVYVGMTGLDPDLRFDKHKAGIQANRYVTEFGLRLLPALYAVFNPMPYEAAREMEVELAISLREAGYGVWQG